MDKNNSINSNKTSSILAGNSAFSDTGSAVLANIQENSAQNSENTFISQESSSKTAKINENSTHHGTFQPKTEENASLNGLNQHTAKENTSLDSLNQHTAKENASLDSLNQQINEENSSNTGGSAVKPEINLLSRESIEAFKSDFPTVDLEKIKNSKDFGALLSTIMQNPTLSQVYSCYNTIVEGARASSQDKMLQAMANMNASVGALSSDLESDNAFFTKEQVLKMSRADIRRNLSKIRQSQSKW